MAPLRCMNDNDLVNVLLKQQLAIERERSLKWVKMIRNWDKYLRSEKVI